jgi:hypothetical protein
MMIEEFLLFSVWMCAGWEEMGIVVWIAAMDLGQMKEPYKI